MQSHATLSDVLYLGLHRHEGGRTLGTGQRFTPKKRTVPVICFESEIDRLVYPLYGLTEDEIKIVEGKGNLDF